MIQRVLLVQKKLWRATSQAALRKVLRKRTVQFSRANSDSKTEEEEDSENCLNTQKVEKRTFESVLPDTQNQEESAGQSSSYSEESPIAENHEEDAVTSTTSQGDITVELVPYGGETSDLKKLTLVIQGENK